jgi:hypothetical protein
MEDQMYWDRFDICEAYYCFAMNYHNGQWSDEYKIFGRLDRMGFKISPLRTAENLSENGREIYENLVSQAGYSQ